MAFSFGAICRPHFNWVVSRVVFGGRMWCRTCTDRFRLPPHAYQFPIASVKYIEGASHHTCKSCKTKFDIEAFAFVPGTTKQGLHVIYSEEKDSFVSSQP